MADEFDPAPLIAKIRGYCEQRGIAVTTFGRLACGNNHLIERLENGRPIQMTTYHKVLKYMRDNPPRATAKAS